VEACPSGRLPLTVLYEQGTSQDKIVIEMKPEDCASCPFREACPVEKTKKGKYKVEYTPKQRRQEERRREEDTAAFRERYAKRSGLESTNGGLKRKHGLGELRVRGRPAVRHALFLKVAGWNLNRATASGKLTTKVAAILRRLVSFVSPSPAFAENFPSHIIEETSFSIMPLEAIKPWIFPGETNYQAGQQAGR